MYAGEFTCGERIKYLIDTEGASEVQARTQVAAEFPVECGPCLFFFLAPPSPPSPPSPPLPPALPPGWHWWMVWGITPSTAAPALIASMTRPEKLRLIEGVVESWIQFDPAPGYYVGTIRGVERLGLPPLLFHDAQSGFRTFDLRTIGTVTSWPSMGALSATWDERLARQMGEAVGLEFRKKGANGLLVRTHTAAHTLKPSRSACFSLLRLHFQFATPPHSRLHPFDALLYPMPFPPLSFSKGKNNCLFHCIHQGPGVDIARVPSAGRNAESLCGEDGHLGAPLAREYIRGVQSQGVAAVAKHFIANLQESDARPPLALDPILSLLLEAYCEPQPA